MGAHLAAVQRVLVAHPLLDKGVAGFAQHRHAARRCDLLDGVPGQARVVDDFRARPPRQQSFRQQADQVIAFDKAAAGVEEETAVEIAVPGQSQIRAVLADRARRGVAAFRQQGVGNAVRKSPVGLMVDLDEAERQARFQRIDNGAGPAVAGVDHDGQGLEDGRIDIRQQVRDIVGVIRPADQSAAPFRGRKLLARRQIANGEQAAVAADRLGLFAHQLHAVVIHRVVAGGHHDSAVELVIERGEVNLLGAAQADIHHARAAVHQPLGQRHAQRRTARTHIVPDRHPARVQQRGVSPADAVG